MAVARLCITHFILVIILEFFATEIASSGRVYAYGRNEEHGICSRCQINGPTTKFLLKPSLEVDCPALRQNRTCGEGEDSLTFVRKWACACCSKPSWYDYRSLLPLTLEFSSWNGHIILHNHSSNCTSRTQMTTQSTDFCSFYYKLEGENRNLTELPENLCEHTRIVVLNVPHNRISQLFSLSCLANLDIFNASYNLLTSIRHTTFDGMQRLRVLDLSHNRIAYIGPLSFQHESTHILYIDLSHNNLINIDSTNVALLKPHCSISFADNYISDITNVMNITLVREIFDKYDSGGYIDFSGNSFKNLPSPQAFGFQLQSEYGTLIFGRYIVEYKDNKIYCDCNVYHIWRHAHEIFPEVIAIGVSLNVCCYVPEFLRHNCVNSKASFDDSEYDKLICNSTDCIPGCRCFYQPHRDTFYIQCTAADLSSTQKIDFKKFREQLTVPELRQKFDGFYVHANFSNNALTTFPHKDFLAHTKMLDLSGNTISKISGSVLRSLNGDAVINITGNPVEKLPKEIQRFRSSQIVLQGLVLQCTCEDEMYKWLPQWLKYGGEGNRGKIFCNTRNRLVDVMDITDETLDCFESHLLVYLSILSVIGIAVIFTFIFRYELYILVRKYRERDSLNSQNLSFRYDAYFVMSDQNESLITWVLNTLCPILENKGYRCFIPIRDLTVGCIREEEIRARIHQSKAFITILTEESDFDLDTWMQIEWRCCWQTYKEFYSTRLVVINYDFVEASSLTNRNLKAITRLGFTVDFSNKNRFYKELLRQIGPPISNCNTESTVPHFQQGE